MNSLLQIKAELKAEPLRVSQDPGACLDSVPPAPRTLWALPTCSQGALKSCGESNFKCPGPQPQTGAD